MANYEEQLAEANKVTTDNSKAEAEYQKQLAAYDAALAAYKEKYAAYVSEGLSDDQIGSLSADQLAYFQKLQTNFKQILASENQTSVLHDELIRYRYYNILLADNNWSSIYDGVSNPQPANNLVIDVVNQNVKALKPSFTTFSLNNLYNDTRNYLLIQNPNRTDITQNYVPTSNEIDTYLRTLASKATLPTYSEYLANLSAQADYANDIYTSLQQSIPHLPESQSTYVNSVIAYYQGLIVSINANQQIREADYNNQISLLSALDTEKAVVGSLYSQAAVFYLNASALNVTDQAVYDQMITSSGIVAKIKNGTATVASIVDMMVPIVNVMNNLSNSSVGFETDYLESIGLKNEDIENQLVSLKGKSDDAIKLVLDTIIQKVTQSAVTLNAPKRDIYSLTDLENALSTTDEYDIASWFSEATGYTPYSTSGVDVSGMINGNWINRNPTTQLIMTLLKAGYAAVANGSVTDTDSLTSYLDELFGQLTNNQLTAYMAITSLDNFQAIPNTSADIWKTLYNDDNGIKSNDVSLTENIKSQLLPILATTIMALPTDSSDAINNLSWEDINNQTVTGSSDKLIQILGEVESPITKTVANPMLAWLYVTPPTPPTPPIPATVPNVPDKPEPPVGPTPPTYVSIPEIPDKPEPPTGPTPPTYVPVPKIPNSPEPPVPPLYVSVPTVPKTPNTPAVPKPKRSIHKLPQTSESSSTGLAAFGLAIFGVLFGTLGVRRKKD